ncbi:carboxymuconolactone decarboxylase family protein [Kitasatospora sp. LaBMicrA B282]|uniref:carboxymuconolactone decarboxylase family protein n=1 Tax=Kitasatospora sp. LaBMicrA B282 TaxID=3420949 RepID=UPI003D1106BD
MATDTTSATSTTPARTTGTSTEPLLRSRMSDPAELIPELKEAGAWLYRVVGNHSVPRTTIGLLQLRAGQLVGSTYLVALHTTMLRKIGESEERLAAVATWHEAPYFTPAERAALALTEAVIQPQQPGERVPDALYAEVAEHYDEKALATLTLAIGQVNFFVPLALIGKPVPNTSPSKQWTPNT